MPHQESTVEPVAGLANALSRWIAIALTVEIVFLAGWMVIQEQWMIPYWSDLAEHNPLDALLSAIGLVFVGYLAYLVLMAPLVIRISTLNALILGSNIRSAVELSLCMLLIRPFAPFGLVLLAAVTTHGFGWWGVAVSGGVVGAVYWLARCRRTRVPKAVFVPRERFQHRLAMLEDAAAESGKAGVPIHIVDHGSCPALAGCAASDGGGEQIIINVALFDSLGDAELRVVLAHELAHSHLHHLRFQCRLNLVLVTTKAVGLALVWMWSLGLESPWTAEAVLLIPRMMLVLCLLSLLLVPVAAAFSRRDERVANRWALEHTADAASFISAMTKLARRQGATHRPPWWQRWFITRHPSLEELLDQARRFAHEHNIPLEESPQEGTVGG